MRQSPNNGVPHFSPFLREVGTYRRLATVLIASLLFLGAGDSARVDRLGRELICMCGCNQLSLSRPHDPAAYRRG